MKITGVKPWLVLGPQPYMASAGEQPGKSREYIFVEVSTDEGVTGWGEVTNSTREHNRAVVSVVKQMDKFLAGDNPANTEATWRKIFWTFNYMGSRGLVTSVISAIDIALWDIRGKVLGSPIYELIGGPVRDAIDLYTHPDGGATVEGIAKSCKAIVESGHRSLKTDPFPTMAVERATPYNFLSGEITRESEEFGIEVVAAIRQAVGPETEILIDLHGRFNVPTAIRLAERMAPFTIGWIEEPVPADSFEALRQVKEAVSVPVCVGERLFTRYDFLPVLKDRLAHYIMPDVTWTGGITELKKISAMAETYYIPVSPHDASGPINILAGAHTMMTVPNFHRLETMRADLHAYDAFIDHPLDIRLGQIHLSRRPGIGVTLNKDFLSAHLAE